MNYQLSDVLGLNGIKFADWRGQERGKRTTRAHTKMKVEGNKYIHKCMDVNVQIYSTCTLIIQALPAGIHIQKHGVCTHTYLQACISEHAHAL